MTPLAKSQLKIAWRLEKQYFPVILNSLLDKSSKTISEKFFDPNFLKRNIFQFSFFNREDSQKVLQKNRTKRAGPWC